MHNNCFLVISISCWFTNLCDCYSVSMPCKLWSTSFLRVNIPMRTNMLQNRIQIWHSVASNKSWDNIAYIHYLQFRNPYYSHNYLDKLDKKNQMKTLFFFWKRLYNPSKISIIAYLSLCWLTTLIHKLVFPIEFYGWSLEPMTHEQANHHFKFTNSNDFTEIDITIHIHHQQISKTIYYWFEYS